MNKIRKRIGSFKFYLILGIIVVVFLPPFAKYQEMRYKDKKLAEQVESVKEGNERRMEEERLLETDINYVEKKAREKIGVVRKGEIVMKEVPVRK